jgi:uncharacterized membrane protein YqiK
MTEAAVIRILLLGFLLALAGPYFRRKFYMRPLAGEAFVREGSAGIRIVREREGCWFFSLIHNITQILTYTHRVTLTSRVITRDARWVILELNFFLRVIGDDRSLQSAAVTLGGDRTNPIRYVTGGGLAHALEDRLNSATRRAAACNPRSSLHRYRMDPKDPTSDS